MILFPIPHGTSFGTLNSPKPDHPELLRSALVALFAEGHLAQGKAFPPRLKRLAMGGWSSGTDTLFKWAKVNSKNPATELVDELYMFDGKNGAKADLKAWFNHDPVRRRLRFIGTAYLEVAANQLKKRLQHPHVFVYPGDPKYWYDSADYKRALSTGSTPPLDFRRSPQDPHLPNDASTLTNIFLKGEALDLDKSKRSSRSRSRSIRPGLVRRRSDPCRRRKRR